MLNLAIGVKTGVARMNHHELIPKRARGVYGPLILE